ncbi:RING-H2 finger protein ATL2-like [Juglans microcarpa x Juglans regia]|uniref:RING-H2 finger protein ATL2-like n=1 Tax=Juglans microcarpa x Juglans regia TaxID=2249226 RepID=UPI001B7EA4D5|nr:RING-H2 finger protein ATL2-like [Juglans microcarpa x Juglans regia]
MSLPAEWPTTMAGQDDKLPRESLPTQTGYALRGKIMLSAIVILFFVVILMVCLHLYARWYLLRARRRHNRRNRRRNNFVFYVDHNPNASAASVTVPTRGLDLSVLKAIPVFLYSSKTHPEKPIPECAVCLCEFEENETGRTLPKCGHSFHIECIDMWFQTHSTCPLCRSPVESGHASENPAEVVISVSELAGIEAGSSSGLCSDCHHEGEQTGQASSSIASRRKPVEFVGVSIEVPSRNESFRDDSMSGSPASQGGFRSPMSRMLSLKRILSRDKRASVSPSTGNAVSCSSVIESDIEHGGNDANRQTQG